MYTLEYLQQKSLKELKEIGGQLNVLPEGDRRCRQNWIDAIAGVNPPLLQLLETSPAEDVQAQESPIIETVEASPAAEDVQAQEPPIESKFGRIVYPRPTQKPNGNKTDETDTDRVRAGSAELHNQQHIDTAESDASSKSSENRLDKSQIRNQLLAIPGDCERDRRQALLHQSVELTDAKTSPGVEVDPVLEPISPVAKTSPGVEVDQSPECVECFGDGYFEDESGLIKSCVCSTKPKLSHQNAQRAIVPAANISKPDQNPILTGIPLSDRFVALYSPPRTETLHYECGDGYKVDTDGQLSLFQAQVVTEPEPPDPDDFESLDDFREAIARWDLEHPTSSFDHCSVHSARSSVHCQPSSVQNEPPNPEDFDSMFAFWAAYDAWVAEPDEPLELSLDSFCLWAHCPIDWYEPAVLLEPSEVMEHLRVGGTSDTSDFFIPTFDRWGDRRDEPPDTGIFARLPKPKPSNFSPQANQPQVRRKSGASQAQVGHKLDSRPETIPKLFPRVAAGSSTQPARSPPGGDAM